MSRERLDELRQRIEALDAELVRLMAAGDEQEGRSRWGPSES